ncbi:hypothetical protein SRHO_G00212910 [Serrasalmus rhombeus]
MFPSLSLCVLALLLVSQQGSGIRWLALSTSNQHINKTQQCKMLPGLVSSQAQLCRTNLELMQTIVQAAREVKKTCQKTFADMRWNCSSIEAPKYLPDLERGTRESAFVYALSAAAISHTIARACTTGDLKLCTCGPIPGDTPEPGYRWGGCADNLHYGLLVGSKFSDAPMKMKKKSGSHANKLMHLHNSEVGAAGAERCSGDEVWSTGQWARANSLCPKTSTSARCVRTSWFTLQSSPDFCTRNEKLGSVGTQERQCNKTSSGSDSCDLMCCGRGYNPYSEKVVERCHCKYHWCCYVTCKKCERTVERYVCK